MKNMITSVLLTACAIAAMAILPGAARADCGGTERDAAIHTEEHYMETDKKQAPKTDGTADAGRPGDIEVASLKDVPDGYDASAEPDGPGYVIPLDD